MNDVEERLNAALVARTQTVTGDPASLRRLQSQLSPRRRRYVLPAVVAAAASVVSVAAVAVLAAGAGTRDRTQDGTYAGAGLGSGPWPADRHFVATSNGTDVVVAADTGSVVATLPAVQGSALDGPVLSRDGERVYGSWGTSPMHVGYLDVESGQFVSLDARPGNLVGVALSGDGNTLIYEWVADGAHPSTSGKFVVRQLNSGHVKVIDTAYAGPQMLPMALSPDGATLAVVPTNNNGPARSLLLQPAAGGASRMVESTCPGQRGAFDQPRWTSSGLFAYERCIDLNGLGTDAVLVKVNPTTGHAEVLRRLSWTGTARIAVAVGASGTIFAVSNETHPDASTVDILDPAKQWAPQRLQGVDGLAVGAAQ